MVNLYVEDGELKSRTPLFPESFRYVDTIREISGSIKKNRKEIVMLCNALALCENKRMAIDIGANIGFHSTIYSKYFKTVHAFEPNSNIFKINLSNVKCHHHLVSSSNEPLTFMQCDDRLHSTHSYVEKTFPDLKVKPHHGTFVPRTITPVTIDQYNFTEVDLIKIDVEGHELDVLKGASQTILKNRPVIILECWGLDRSALAYCVNELGYKHMIGFAYSNFIITDWIPGTEFIGKYVDVELNGNNVKNIELKGLQTK